MVPVFHCLGVNDFPKREVPQEASLHCKELGTGREESPRQSGSPQALFNLRGEENKALIVMRCFCYEEKEKIGDWHALRFKSSLPHYLLPFLPRSSPRSCPSPWPRLAHFLQDSCSVSPSHFCFLLFLHFPHRKLIFQKWIEHIGILDAPTTFRFEESWEKQLGERLLHSSDSTWHIIKISSYNEFLGIAHIVRNVVAGYQTNSSWRRLWRHIQALLKYLMNVVFDSASPTAVHGTQKLGENHSPCFILNVLLKCWLPFTGFLETLDQVYVIWITELS